MYRFFLQPTLDMDFLDFYLCETLSSLREACLLMRLMQHCPKPYCLSFTLDDETAELRETNDKLTDLSG